MALPTEMIEQMENVGAFSEARQRQRRAAVDEYLLQRRCRLYERHRKLMF